MKRLPKRLRQQQLTKVIEENPFITDEQLTRKFGVSIQTIRLDRLELGIPEYRERIKMMAEKSYDQVRSLPLHEVIGEVIDLQLDKSGISIFEIGEEHVFSRTKIARGHHLFAQANSLAVALIDDEIALDGFGGHPLHPSGSPRRKMCGQGLCSFVGRKKNGKGEG